MLYCLLSFIPKQNVLQYLQELKKKKKKSHSFSLKTKVSRCSHSFFLHLSKNKGSVWICKFSNRELKLKIIAHITNTTLKKAFLCMFILLN